MMTITIVNWCILLLVSSFICFKFLQSKFDDSLHYVQCDVGQGDAILIWKGTMQLLVDVGGEKGEVDRCLDEFIPFWDRQIELLVLTHFDLDHVGGIKQVMAKYSIKTIFTGEQNSYYMSKSGLEPILTPIMKAIDQSNAQIHYVSMGEEYNLGEIRIHVLWPEHNGTQMMSKDEFYFQNENLTSNSNSQQNSDSYAKKTDKNYNSVVLSLKFDDISMLLTGDIPMEVEEKLVTNKLVSDHYHILKVAHHGSRFSSSVDFLKEIQPDIVTIGVGKNSYGHPHREVLERIEAINSYLCRTDVAGNVEIVVSRDKVRLVQKELCVSQDSDDN